MVGTGAAQTFTVFEVGVKGVHPLPSVQETVTVLVPAVDQVTVMSFVVDPAVMLPPDETPQAIHDEFYDILGKDIPGRKVKKTDFYDEAKSPDTFLVIATGEIRRFANILITIGVVKY